MTCELCKRPQIRRELKWNLGRCTAQRYDSNHRCKGRYVMLFEKERDEAEKANKKYRSDAPPVRCNECSHNTRRDVTWDALELERNNGWCLNKKCLTYFRGKDRYEYALAEAKFDEWIRNGCGGHPPEPLPDRYWAPIPEGPKTVTRLVGGMI